MLTMTTPRQATGFTLIELMIGIAILAIAMALGIPSFAEWIQNSQIRTAGESISAGLQAARNEAIRRNTPIEFTLTGNGGAGETGWQIAIRNTGVVLQAQTAGEGSRNATVVTKPADARTITFTGMGRVANPNSDASSPIKNICIDNPKLGTAVSRNLRIEVVPDRGGIPDWGGATRMCDPNTATPDPRACPLPDVCQ